MRKFRLLKDIVMPNKTIKTGSEFEEDSLGVLWYVNKSGVQGDPVYEKKAIDNFDEWFEEVIEPTSSIYWKPKKRDTYWCRSIGGLVRSYLWEGDEIDETIYALGNVYRTKEECGKAIELQKAIATLRRSSTFEPDWEDGDQEKFMVWYDHDINKLCVDVVSMGQYTSSTTPVYPSEEVAEASTKKYKKEWLTFFGVEE